VNAKEGYPLKRLEEVCDINPSAKEVINADEDIDVSFVPMSSISIDGQLLSMQSRSLNEVRKGFTYFRDNDVLLAKITPCMENGKRWVARDLTNGIGFGSTEFHVLRPHSEITTEWLYYFISQKKFRDAAEINMTGTAGQKRVPTQFIKNVTIPVPSIDVQKRLTERLTKTEKLIQKQVIAKKTAERITQAVFLQMFGSPELNSKKWKKVKIGEVTLSHKQGFFTRSEYSKTGTKLVRITDITESGNLDYDTMPYLYLDSKIERQFKVQVGDFLFARSGSIGRCAVVEEDIPCVFGSYIIRFRFDPKKIDNWFMLQQIKLPELQKAMRIKAHGSANTNINAENIKSIEIALPPIELQKQFAYYSKKVILLLEKQRDISRIISRFFESLLSQSFDYEEIT
jgi:type I restriction enzyme S subunit